jgi:hypothetical protein
MDSISILSFNLDDILDCFCLFAEVDKDDKFLPFIQNEIANLIKYIKNTIDFDQEENRLNFLIAALAYKKYCTFTDDSDFHIGDITINSKSNRLSAATELVDEYSTACSDLLIDRTFIFRSIA